MSLGIYHKGPHKVKSRPSMNLRYILQCHINFISNLQLENPSQVTVPQIF